MDTLRALEWVLVVIAMLGAMPLFAGAYQLLLVGAHRYHSHLDQVGPDLPRTAVIVPAWNEAAVLALSIDRLLALDYPRDRVRIFVVDDASTDDTPAVVAAKAEQYPGAVVHLRRQQGGQGKAHTLNHGLRHVLADDWAECVLIMDADVVFTQPSLRRMVRHLADPEVGAVTAYIKEGSTEPNGIQRAVAFEYAVAQAGARRAQNVIGAVACLAGGAQLHTRANIEAIGGQIDTTTLAEDTVTTLLTQIEGRRVVFEPNAVVWAEEPRSIDGLWKQRLRWARGNVQVNRMFRDVWFRPAARHRLGSFSFGLFWFTTFLLPVFMIASSAALVALWLLDSDLARHSFDVLWIVSGLSFLFMVVFTMLIDPAMARRSWRRALMFPGIVSVVIIVAACFPALARWGFDEAGEATRITVDHDGQRYVRLALYLWVSLCMVAAWLVWRLERAGARRLAAVGLWLVGYGPLLCAITFAAYVAEARGAAAVWDKTEKVGSLEARR